MENHADLFPPARPQVRHRRRRLHPGQLCGAHRQGRQCGLRSDRAPALGQSGRARRAEKEVTQDGSQVWRNRMKILGKALAGAALCVAAGISVATAHHSTTMFDHSRTLTLKGVVLELRWTNPHVTLLVKGTVADGEEPSEWLLEMTSPGNLVRAGGWARNAGKAGDEGAGGWARPEGRSRSDSWRPQASRSPRKRASRAFPRRKTRSSRARS